MRPESPSEGTKVYIGTTEAANILALSQQRTCWLHRHDPRFPKPRVRVGGVCGWDREQIVEYARERKPKVGRPSKTGSTSS